MSSTKTTKREHTHEPWLLEGTDLRATPEAMSRGFPDFIAEFEDPDDAARAHACVNALAGCPNPDLAMEAARKALTNIAIRVADAQRSLPDSQKVLSTAAAIPISTDILTECVVALALLGATTP